MARGALVLVGAGGFDKTGFECAGADESVFVSKDSSSAVSGGAGCGGVVTKSLVRSMLVCWSFMACFRKDSSFCFAFSISVSLSCMSRSSWDCLSKSLFSGTARVSGPPVIVGDCLVI